MPDPRTRSMHPAEFALIRQRLGLSLADTARTLGVGDRAPRRWVQDDLAGPGPEAAAQLRDMLAAHDKKLNTELAKLRDSKTRPVTLMRYATEERMEAAGVDHPTLRSQDAYLAELAVLLHHEGISVEITGDER